MSQLFRCGRREKRLQYVLSERHTRSAFANGFHAATAEHDTDRRIRGSCLILDDGRVN